jgi:hypothetical protein
MAAYTENEQIYLWKQTFADNISGEEIQVISTHMPRYVDANSLKDVQDYLDGVFDTQRTMQANRDRFERKQLLQVFGEPDYDSPLLSASKTDQKRKSSSAATTKDKPDRKRLKSVKKSSSASKSNAIPLHKQCKRSGCVNRGTSLTHTHAQCFYKTSDAKGSSPTTSLLAGKEKAPHHAKPKPSGPTPLKATGAPRQAFPLSSGSSSAKPRKDPSEVDCWTCGQKGHY